MTQLYVVLAAKDVFQTVAFILWDSQSKNTRSHFNSSGEQDAEGIESKLPRTTRKMASRSPPTNGGGESSHNDFVHEIAIEVSVLYAVNDAQTDYLALPDAECDQPE